MIKGKIMNTKQKKKDDIISSLQKELDNMKESINNKQMDVV